MELNKNQIRQGDVLLVRVGDSAGTGTAAVLAYGNSTNHNHELRGEGAAVNAQEATMVDVPKDTTLDHQTHTQLNVPSGKYESFVQVQATQGNIKRVVD